MLVILLTSMKFGLHENARETFKMFQHLLLFGTKRYLEPQDKFKTRWEHAEQQETPMEITSLRCFQSITPTTTKDLISLKFQVQNS